MFGTGSARRWGATGNIDEALEQELRQCDDACVEKLHKVYFCDRRIANAISIWSRKLPLAEVARHLSIDDDLVLMLEGVLQSLPDGLDEDRWKSTSFPGRPNHPHNSLSIGIGEFEAS